MSVRLIILGLLRQEELHGYEIKHVIEEHMADWAKVTTGSIYFALSKLAEEGKIRESSVERDGKRPEKTVYEITEEGKREFLDLLRARLGTSERECHEIDQAIAFLDALPKKEAVELFKARIAEEESALANLRKHKAAQMRREDVPASAAAIFSHGLKLREAELAWSREVLAELESGRLSRKRG